jgi:Protein of unknown function (DUF3828)
MRLHILIAATLALVACSPATPTQAPTSAATPASAATQTAPPPADTIRPLYERYTARTETNFPPLLEQAPWSAAMRARLVAMMARSEAAQAPILDFDPFINAQDWQLTNLRIADEAVVAESRASVRASFNNAGRTEEVVFDLVWEDDGWRVDNMRGQDWNLTTVAQANP